MRMNNKPLASTELEIISDYFSKNHGGAIPDWPVIQTSMGKVDGPIFQRLLVTIDAYRWLVEELR